MSKIGTVCATKEIKSTRFQSKVWNTYQWVQADMINDLVSTWEKSKKSLMKMHPNSLCRYSTLKEQHKSLCGCTKGFFSSNQCVNGGKVWLFTENSGKCYFGQ